MAITYWRGPSGSSLASGDFAVAANWSRAQVPDASSSVYLPEGAYVVSVSTSATIQAASVGAGATLLVRNSANFSIAEASTNDGTIEVDRATLSLRATLINNGTITGSGATSIVMGGTIVNEGLIGTSIEGSGTLLITSALDNRAGGVVRSSTTDTILLSGTVTNAGLFDAQGAGIGYFDGGNDDGVFTNLSNGVLTGGRWHAGVGAGLQLKGTAITALQAGTEVSLDASSRFLVQTPDASRALDETLLRIYAGGELHLLGGRGFGNGQSLAVDGTLELGGGTLDLRSLNTSETGRIVGYGTIDGEARWEGATRIVGGTLHVTDDFRLGHHGSVTGRGTLELEGLNNQLDESSRVSIRELAVEAGRLVVMADRFRVGHLTVDDAILDFGRAARTLTGAVDLHDGLVRGDATLRLAGADVASTGVSAFSLNVLNAGTIDVDGGTLTFDRALSGAGSVVVGNGGTLVFSATSSVARAQTIALADDATLQLAASDTFKGVLSGFGAGDTIELSGFSADTTRLHWRADRDGSGGTLSVIGEGDKAVLHFANGTYSTRDFAAFQFEEGVLAITYQPDGQAAVATAAAFGEDAPAFTAGDLPLCGPDLHTIVALV